MTLELDPELALALAALPEGVDPGAHLLDMNVITMLRSTPELLKATGGRLPTDDRVVVDDRMIAGPEGEDTLGVRVYLPRTLAAGGADARLASAPGIVFFHGSAFVLGDTYAEEYRCLRYAADAGCVVVSVEYRLAPEHPFPAAVEDGRCAFDWTLAHAPELGIDPGRVAVGGASAGGALAAALALSRRDGGGPAPVFQLLVYPVIDDRMATPSMRAFDATPLWTNLATAHMWDHYLGPRAGRGEVSPYAAPARATDLSGLPAAYVMTAELDPLRDEGIDYARRLIEAGVPTELQNFSGACHGFDLIAPRTAIGRRALDGQVDALARALGGRPVET